MPSQPYKRRATLPCEMCSGTPGHCAARALNCPACGAVYEDDEDLSHVPTCPGCGTRDTWEVRQHEHSRELVGAIDRCPTLRELAVLGKRLYRLELSSDQAGVAWTHYRLCKARLEEPVTLRRQARALLARVERAPRQVLPRLGSRLYRLQHRGAVPPVLDRVASDLVGIPG